MTDKQIFNRSELLFGEEGMRRLGEKRVIIFGVGGVGSWCAESLIRTGICHLTIVDSDKVNISNCNRQLMATTKTIDRVKVDALKERLLDINPDADITTLACLYTEETAEEFHLDQYDYIIDCIDSLKDKASLILHATRLAHEGHCHFFSSMGAALKMDPTKITVAEFWKVNGDPLARAIRNRFKRNKTFPASKFLCVYSEERPLENCIVGELTDADRAHHKVQSNGSLCHITAIFGMTLSGLVVKSIYSTFAS